MPPMTSNDLDLPVLSTERLRVRPLTADDVDACEALFKSVGWSDGQADAATNRARRARWLAWTGLSYEHLAMLHQPPYGERGIEHAATGDLVGLVGLVPSFARFGALPSFAGDASRRTPEVGLFWLVGTSSQGHGYATEAARGLAEHAFRTLRVARLVATTEHDNERSIRVMERLGMTIERTEHTAPDQLQVVGILRP